LNALASAVIGVPGKAQTAAIPVVSRGFATPHGAASTVLASA